MKKRVPKAVQHDWYRNVGYLSTYDCRVCKAWTVNLPLYRAEVCPRRDRRKRRVDRRIS